MSDTADVTRRQAWLMAARPHTLPAAAAPVVVGTGLAVHAGLFAALPALAALVGAALIQVGTNFANDYYDAVQGADTDEREGFTRVTAGGLIEPERVKFAMYATFALAILDGTYLVYVGGLPIVVVGLAASRPASRTPAARTRLATTASATCSSSSSSAWSPSPAPSTCRPSPTSPTR